MTQKNHRWEDRLTRRGSGTYAPGEWIAEGNGLLASARIMRQNWVVLRRNLKRQLRARQDQQPLNDAWIALNGLPRASVLLLGYAAEMYLKAGLAKAYIGCSSEMYERDLKRRYSHRLEALARDIDFPALETSLEDLSLLQRFIVVDARYPVTPHEEVDFFAATNSRTNIIWSRRRFAALCRLVRAIHIHVSRIDRDEQNPSSSSCLEWGEGGYIAWRACGHLWQRLTFRVPKGIVIKKDADLECVRQVASETSLFLHAPWETLIVQEDTPKETKVWRDPRPYGVRNAASSSR